MQSAQNRILVAVWMVTYNHDSYIEQALNSVIQQKRDFDLIVFLNDDCSTDATADICFEYAARYPEVIRFKRNEKNLGPNKNALEVYQKCKQSGAKYIALLEGDDFWSDDFKLQKQVSFLEEHDTCSLVFHKVSKLTSRGLVNIRFPDIGSLIDVGEFITRGGVMIHTSTILLRSNFLTFTDTFEYSIVGDKYLILRLGAQGKFGFLPEYLSVYRVHDQGIWSGSQDQVSHRTAYVKGYIELLNTFNQWTAGEYASLILRQIDWDVYSHLKKHLHLPLFGQLHCDLSRYLSWKSKVKLFLFRIVGR